MYTNENSWWGKRLGKEQNNSPIKFKESPIRISPLKPFSQNLNGEKQFAITSQTEGGKYVRGDLLFFNLNGVEIYAPINCILMINTESNSVFIRNGNSVSQNISNDRESIKYLILYTDLDYEDSETENPFRWELVTGMSKALYSIIDNATRIDIDKSIILAETVSAQDALSIREFCEHIKNAELFFENDDLNDFNINDYAGSNDYNINVEEVTFNG